MRRAAQSLAAAAPLRIVVAVVAGALAAVTLLAASPRPAAADATLPFGPCPSGAAQQCATLSVPLDRADPTGPQVRLAVRRVLAGAAPTPDAVVALAGGPGQSALPLVADVQREMAPALHTRDLLMFDQRGTGASDPLHCPAATGRGSAATLIALCAQQIGTARGDFTTADSVADLEALRAAAGYQRLVLFGTSYGTKVALDYAEQYPQNVEALVLDSTVPPQGQDPLQRSSFAAIPGVIADLCAGGSCRRITPDPVAEMARLVARMERRPLHGHVFDGHGRRIPVTMDASALFQLLVDGDLNPQLRAELPASVHAALRGDPAALLRLTLLSEGYVPSGAFVRATRTPGGATMGGVATDRPAPPHAARVLHGSAGDGAPVGATRPAAAPAAQSDEFDAVTFIDTICEEEPFPWAPRDATPTSRLQQAVDALRAIPARALYPFDRTTDLVTSNIPMCLRWPVASPPPPAAASLPDVPTLILSGADDLRTPTSDARAVAQQIPGAQLLVVPHTGHSVIGSDLSPCSATAVSAFFAGTPVQPCGRVHDYFLPTPVPPRRLGDVPAAHGLGVHAGRTLTAVQYSLTDLRREIIGAILNLNAALPSGARFGGLRGGDATTAHGRVVLHDLSYVPGVTLSGSVPIKLLAQGKGRPARLLVRGHSAAAGTVVIEADNRASGVLGGRRFRIALASSAATRDSTWPLIVRHRVLVP